MRIGTRNQRILFFVNFDVTTVLGYIVILNSSSKKGTCVSVLKTGQLKN